MSGLTATQKVLYDYLVGFLVDHHRQPTLREAADAMGWTSPSAVRSTIKVLVKKGHLQQDGRHWKVANATIRIFPIGNK